MSRRVEDREHVAEFDDAACVHDDDPIGQLGDQTEIVSDQHDRRMRLALAALHLDDLRLDRHVESSGGLVGNENLWIVRDSHRDHRALPHAA